MKKPDKKEPFSGTRPIPAPPPPPPIYSKIKPGGTFRFEYKLDSTRRSGVQRHLHVECYMLLSPRVKRPRSVPRARVEDVLESTSQRLAIAPNATEVKAEIRAKKGVKGIHRILVVATVGNISGYRLLKIVA